MCQTTDKITQNTCPIKSFWQEKQCWGFQCDRVSGDTSCESLWNEPCDYQIQLQNHNKQMANQKLESSPIKSEISKKIEEIRLNIAKSIAGYKGKMITIKLQIKEKYGISFLYYKIIRYTKKWNDYGGNGLYLFKRNLKAYLIANDVYFTKMRFWFCRDLLMQVNSQTKKKFTILLNIVGYPI